MQRIDTASPLNESVHVLTVLFLTRRALFKSRRNAAYSNKQVEGLQSELEVSREVNTLMMFPLCLSGNI